ncbi:helix-turn-helix domain-containing protein [Zunongwangia sp. F260]|uniref:Helix-turn-helix domain-containing protein n=1 Tax=Autumnicola lenta TaxID=3075593 RepID=A0ABU3CJ62_9FLAO|nr:helix-turn-helix domain-containing protein [Zunongwangia sp. F260]MDT0646336.1 helix-turn-helix domain-containing protein [Zunongwangia sp. F260]
MEDLVDVKLFRLRAGLTQKELAKKINCTIGTISLAEREKPSKKLSYKIRTTFPEYFRKWKREKPLILKNPELEMELMNLRKENSELKRYKNKCIWLEKEKKSLMDHNAELQEKLRKLRSS